MAQKLQADMQKAQLDAQARAAEVAAENNRAAADIQIAQIDRDGQVSAAQLKQAPSQANGGGYY